MEVGFDRLGPLGTDASLALLDEGDGGSLSDEVERYAESLKECSSAAVANRDSIKSPLCDSISSCTPTVQPDR